MSETAAPPCTSAQDATERFTLCAPPPEGGFDCRATAPPPLLPAAAAIEHARASGRGEGGESWALACQRERARACSRTPRHTRPARARLFADTGMPVLLRALAPTHQPRTHSHTRQRSHALTRARVCGITWLALRRSFTPPSIDERTARVCARAWTVASLRARVAGRRRAGDRCDARVGAGTHHPHPSRRTHAHGPTYAHARAPPRPCARVHPRADAHTRARLRTRTKVLLQQRSVSKDTWPGLWDISAAGHIEAGQDSLETAYRVRTCNRSRARVDTCAHGPGRERK